MGQVSPYLRRAVNGHSHWCPGCQEMHVIPDSWTFNGDVNRPTFGPSVKISGNKLTRDASGKWAGGWERDAAGNLIPEVCHYFLRDGRLEFCGDSTHALAGQNVPLPELPAEYRDPAP